MQQFMDRPVLDRTELSGEFDLMVDSASGSITREPFELLSSLQDRLGLKIESTRAEVPTVIIRRIQPPTEN